MGRRQVNFGGGSNLPPGCSVRDIEAAIGWDGPYRMHCTCGAFLPLSPVRVENHDAYMDCPGSDVEMPEWLDCDVKGTHGPHKFLFDTFVVSVYKCSKCGKEKEVK